MADATQAISAGHGADLAIGWYIIVGLWAVVVIATIAVLVDSLLGYRKRRVAEHADIIGMTREPLLMYTVAAGVVIAVWIASMVPVSESYVYTMSIAAGFAAIIAVALIFTYLLRMVFPSVPADKAAEYAAVRGAKGASGADRHEVTVLDRADDADDADRAELDGTTADLGGDDADDNPFDMELFADDNPKGA